MNSPRTTLYRDKYNGRLMGVCAGIADYTGINVFWIRFAAVASIFITGGPSIIAYLIAGFLLNKKPPHLYRDEREQKYWQGVRQNPKRTAREIRASFRDIDRRLAAVETHYVTSNPRLTAEIERLR
ncbi:envelope stress response membrane protein PspC [Erythrobacter sanguineus]|jgi:phage shock protein C|uniref:Phage shock protein C (PspC) family protein n=1 Tax=Erythrobacter sanguineus TaxID=198312 RepID=A0A1M7T1V0_9SPHN|nr:envelope stress response membrane protein PspC [Erythrobacter sanguineus]MCR9180259.1 envelope stress response membrane protein PspC [Erythrobacteraceae bacterium]SHN64644.1 phage shock protein C (PspC) family protein [Erythrobacter sanguineus]